MQQAHAADGSSLYIDLAQDYTVKELFRKLFSYVECFDKILGQIALHQENKPSENVPFTPLKNNG